MANIDINVTVTGITTGATVDCINNIVSLERQNAPDIDVDLSCLLSGMSTTDIFTTGATLNGSVAIFNRNDGNDYTLDLSSLTGGTSVGDFWSLTGNTIASGNTLGTINNLDLVFRRNSVDVGRFNSDNRLVVGDAVTGTKIGTQSLRWNSNAFTLFGNDGSSEAVSFITNQSISRFGNQHFDVRFVDGTTTVKTIFGANVATNDRVEIRGLGTTSATFGFKVHNSTGTNNALSVRDDGRVDISAGRLHVGNSASSGRIWFGNATAPTGVNNGYIDIDSTSSATGSLLNIPGTDANNETTRLTIQHRDRADGIRIYPAITGGAGGNVGKSVIGKSTGAGLTFGIDFRFFGSVSVGTLGQTEGYRFYSYDATTALPNNLLRFQIGNGATVVPSLFVNSQLGVTDNSTITVNSSAVLDLQSTTKGFLPPRMTTAQRDLITTPATGLMIYNTTTNRPNFFDGTNWVAL